MNKDQKRRGERKKRIFLEKKVIKSGNSKN